MESGVVKGGLGRKQAAAMKVEMSGRCYAVRVDKSVQEILGDCGTVVKGVGILFAKDGLVARDGKSSRALGRESKIQSVARAGEAVVRTLKKTKAVALLRSSARSKKASDDPQKRRS